MNILLRHVVGELAQRTDVIQNPERPPMRSHDEIVVLDHQIVHRRGRQIQLERPPLRSIIERNIDSIFRARVKQSAFLRIFPHGANKRAVRNSIDQLRPGLAVIARLVDVRFQIVASDGDPPPRKPCPHRAEKPRSG